MSFTHYPFTGVIESEPITTPDGVTYEIDWDGAEPGHFVPAADSLRPYERGQAAS